MPASLDFPVLPVKEQTREIRHRLCDEHLSGGLIYLEAGHPPLRNGCDVYYKFRADSDFVYATGCRDQPGAAALLDTESGSLTLMVEKQEEHIAFWMGPQPTADEFAEAYGADRVCYTSDLGALLRESAQGRDVHVTNQSAKDRIQAAVSGSALAHQNGAGSHTPESLQAESGTPESTGWKGPRVLDALLPKVLQRCRSHKTDAELACLIEASRISSQGHIAAWQASRANPGSYEYSLEGAFTGAVLAAGAHDLGYPCIVGAGTNAAILHYETNRSKVQPNDLVLIDAGAEFRSYTADITRTFPANGVFTARQRDAYNAVLSMQELAISRMQLGAVWSEVDLAARTLQMQLLQDLGMLTQGHSIESLLEKRMERVFMPHGLGHFLGLDVHDMAAQGMVPPPGTPLEQGNVITVEPGLYFVDMLLSKAHNDPSTRQMINWDTVARFREEVGGIRIEDNVAVGVKGGMKGPEGVLNLTMAAGVPKATGDIEDLMRL